MKRVFSWFILAASVALIAPALSADVKTQAKTTFKLEGMLGTFINRAYGGDKGMTSTMAVKGNRMSTTRDTQTEIVDLTEQKVYTVDTKKKEYTVKTFAQMRAEAEKAKADMEKRAAEMNPEDKAQAQEAAKQLEFDVDVKETGQRKAIAGHDTREVVLTIAMREKGKTLEEGGGIVMTNTLWLAPKIAALDEVAEFQMKYFQAVYGGLFTGADMQQMTALASMLPGAATMREKMVAEGRKLQGTALLTSSVMEGVKSAEQMAQAQQQQQSSGGGGLGGMLARRMMGNRGQAQPRSVFLTTTNETLSVATSVAAGDVTIPADFKEKK